MKLLLLGTLLNYILALLEIISMEGEHTGSYDQKQIGFWVFQKFGATS